MADTLFDRIVRHQVQLERAKAGEAKRVSATVKALDADIVKIVSSLPENYTKRQLDRAIERIDKLITGYYANTVQPTLDQVAATVVDFETDFAEETVENFILDEGEELKKSNKTKTLAAVQSQTYQGKRLSTWTKSLGRDKSKRVAAQMRTRAANGDDVDSLVTGVNVAVKKSNSNATAVSNAYVNHASTLSRDSVYNQNEDYVKQIVWSSILDSGTTVTCGVRSNKLYDAKTKAPIGHDNAWNGGPGAIHWGCRSMGIPTRADGMTKVGGEFVPWDQGDRTAIEADKGYKRGDNKRDNGTRYKIPSKNNKLKAQTVRASTDYETWLKRQPRAFVEDVLGVSRAEQFINGNAQLSDFVVKSGRELTVKELQTKLKSG